MGLSKVDYNYFIIYHYGLKLTQIGFYELEEIRLTSKRLEQEALAYIRLD